MALLRSRLMMPTITSSREFVSYVLLVNAFGLAVALSIDVAQQLIYFTTWAAAARSWLLTVLVVAVIATPVAVIFARAQRELHQAKQALEKLSQTDSLTGLPNRRALLKASQDSSGAHILVILDVDRFKQVNDTFGHGAGDTVLQSISRMIDGHLSAYGPVGRLGGEEFALISSGATLETVLAALGELLHSVQRTAIVTSGNALHVTLSAGVACRSTSGPFEKLYSEADEALYAAKNSGRNRIALGPSARKALQLAPAAASAGRSPVV